MVFEVELGVWLAWFFTKLSVGVTFLLAQPRSPAEKLIAERILKRKARFLRPLFMWGNQRMQPSTPNIGAI